MPKAASTRATAPNGDRSEYLYALKAYTVRITEKGWWITKAWAQFAGEKPEWNGPFETIEAACLAIARRLATEIADRHTMMIDAHKMKPGDPLYGLKATTRLRKARNGSASPAAKRDKRSSASVT
jgi:hypothetical protein